MVTAQEVRKELGIPRYTLYRLIDEGKIPYHELAPELWHKADRRRLRFRVSEVRAALERLRGERAGE